MPPTPIPDGFGIATLKVLRTGASAPDVWTFGYALPAGASTPDGNANTISSSWVNQFTAASTLNVYTYIGCHVLQNEGGFLSAGDKVSSVAGTLSAAAAAPAIAVRVTKRTAFAGRKYRGRVFLPPAYVSETNINEAGVIDASTLASIQTKATAFYAAMVTADMPLHLLHSGATAPTAITSLIVRTSVGTQRRRQDLL